MPAILVAACFAGFAAGLKLEVYFEEDCEQKTGTYKCTKT